MEMHNSNLLTQKMYKQVSSRKKQTRMFHSFTEDLAEPEKGESKQSKRWQERVKNRTYWTADFNAFENLCT